MARPQAIYFLSPSHFDNVYGPEERAAVEAQVQVVDRLTARRFAARGKDAGARETWPKVEVILASWGLARVDEAFLARFPKLKMICYGAGSIRGFATPAMWRRGIRVTSASAANAIPVSEFALSQILYGLKQGWRHARSTREGKWARHGCAGAYRSTVGLLSLGMIGRMTAERLRTFDVRLVAYDPFVSPKAARALGVELAPLDEVFARADVVSCHTPHLPETVGLLKKSHFAAMKEGATFLNTGRGAVVDEAGLISVLRRRPDLTAVLDVTFPEPPPARSPLYTLPNVVLTPHIAGSLGPECRRMGQTMADELRRYLAGKPLHYEIDEKKAAIMA